MTRSGGSRAQPGILWVRGTFVDHPWERGHPARLRPGMATLPQQEIRAPAFYTVSEVVRFSNYSCRELISLLWELIKLNIIKANSLLPMLKQINALFVD
jgi:hypothetical protein